MNMAVTITFDPGVDEQQDVLRRVAQAYALAPDADVLAGPRVQDAADGWWNAATMRTWVGALKPVARNVLLHLVGSSPCPVESVEAASGLSPYRYAEAQASLQDALRSVPGAYRLPFDVVDGCYTFDDDLADLIVRALEDVNDYAA